MYLLSIAIGSMACNVVKQSAYVIVNKKSSEEIFMQLVISNQENEKTKEKFSYSLKPGYSIYFLVGFQRVLTISKTTIMELFTKTSACVGYQQVDHGYSYAGRCPQAAEKI